MATITRAVAALLTDFVVTIAYFSLCRVVYG